jgi:hypothetical protein
MASDTHLPFSQHNVLSTRECAETRDRVLALRDQWTRRPEGGFFTLGTVSTYDAPGKHAQYLKAAKVTNPLLQKSFEWLHERLRLFFEELLGEAVMFDPRYALPGFHIFVLNSVVFRSRDNVAAGAHFDLQWMDAIPGKVPKQTLSFTLPVELPLGGASLQIWRVRYQQALRREFSAPDYASRHPSRTVRYRRGRILVHDGLTLHGIGHGSVARPKGFRITLQGHGVRSSKGWMLYW